MEVNQVLLDLNDINWSELRKNREWLMQHTSLEARTLYQFINELWNDDAFYYWSMMRDQKKWLEILLKLFKIRLWIQKCLHLKKYTDLLISHSCGY